MAIQAIRRVVRRFVPLVAVGILTIVAQAASAQENTKIGVVNLDRIMRDSSAAKAANAKLEGEFSKRSKDLQDAGARLKASADKFDKDSPVLSDTERQRRQRELADMDKDIQRRQREFSEDINQRKQEETAAIYDRVNRAVRQIGDSEKFDIVFQDAVYVNPKVDITEKVLKLLNAPVTAPAPSK